MTNLRAPTTPTPGFVESVLDAGRAKALQRLREAWLAETTQLLAAEEAEDDADGAA